MELPYRNDKSPLRPVLSKSYSSISSGPPTPRLHGPLPSEPGYATFLRLDGPSEGPLVPLHEITRWDMHFKAPFYHTMITNNHPCDGRDFGANERNFLAWLRLAAGFTSTSFAFIINFYLPPGRSILGPDRVPITEPSLQNKGALAWGIVFLLCALFTIINAFLCYVEHMHHVGRRVLMVQFSAQTLVFFGLSCLALFAAGAYMMTGGLIQARRSYTWIQ
ncbi:hypothetical protein V1525DRAFT_404997 [Lipomyces kononenkoae]|uniref:Uncharacterized protein n=1 Tax=Lipomyces kononenkoae TaxID=34357 RepID=A0ACC3SZP1_LIPKO